MDIGIDLKTAIQIKVIDIYGRMVKEYNTPGVISRQEIDLSDQSSGLYLITVQGIDISKSFKVIKE